ncbi:uncharacterized protein V6R79_004253 [Siganus canaliculatus]
MWSRCGPGLAPGSVPPTDVLHKDSSSPQRERECFYCSEQRSHGRFQAHAQPFTTCTWRACGVHVACTWRLHPLLPSEDRTVIFDSQLKSRGTDTGPDEGAGLTRTSRSWSSDRF